MCFRSSRFNDWAVRRRWGFFSYALERIWRMECHRQSHIQDQPPLRIGIVVPCAVVRRQPVASNGFQRPQPKMCVTLLASQPRSAFERTMSALLAGVGRPCPRVHDMRSDSAGPTCSCRARRSPLPPEVRVNSQRRLVAFRVAKDSGTAIRFRRRSALDLRLSAPSGNLRLNHFFARNIR